MKGRSRSRARGRMLASRTLPMGFNPAHVSGLTSWFKANTGVTLGGTPLATGTTPPVVTIAATDGAQPTASGLRIEITTGGARGTALFKWSVNDGSTYEETSVATAATVVLASANITVSFPVGTYATDNVYRATVSQWDSRGATALNVVQATASKQPIRASAGPVRLIFDGTNDFLANGLGSNYITAAAGSVLLAFKLRAVTLNNATVYDNDTLFSDGGADYGLSIRNAGPAVMRGYNYDGGYDEAVPALGVTAGTAYVADWHHGGGTLTMALNDGARSTVASGNTQGLGTWAFQIAASQGVRASSIDLYEFITYNVAISAADRSAVIAYLRREWSI